MSSKATVTHRDAAEIYTGEAICKQKSLDLLSKLNLPKGLLPLNDILEVGQNHQTGFVWLKQKNPIQHKFKQISRTVWYDKEVTAFVEDRKMKKLTGVKSKELLIWITINEIYIQENNEDKITFGTPTGISKTFPVSAFQEEEEEGGKN